jgi:hypothetical protein
MIFKTLSREEFERLSVQERMDYLQRLMADLREKLDETRQQADRAKKSLPGLQDSVLGRRGGGGEP